MKKGAIWILMAVLAMGCEPVDTAETIRPPQDLIPRDQMLQMLVDVHLIEGARSGMRVLGDSVPVDVYYQGLFDKYDVSKAQYESSFAYYSHFPEEMMVMYDIVIDSLNLKQVQVTEELRAYRKKFDGTEEEEEWEELEY